MTFDYLFYMCFYTLPVISLFSLRSRAVSVTGRIAVVYAHK
jgi:hypothetical protein